MGGMFGGGGGGNQSVTQKFEPPTWATEGAGGWGNYMAQVPATIDYLTNRDNTVYSGGQPFDTAGNFIGTPEQLAIGQGRVANLNDLQKQAMGNLFNASKDPMYSTEVNSYLKNVINGGLSDPRIYYNEFGPASNILSNQVNPFAGLQNSFGGATNPAFENLVSSARHSAEDSFNRTTNAQTMAAAAQGGAFGGSAYDELMAAQSGELNKQLNSMEAGLRSDQYGRAAQLEQERLGQLNQAGAQTIGNLFAGEESRLNRAFQGNEANYARQGQQWRDMATTELQALGMMPQISNMQTSRAQAQMGVGDVQRQYEQQFINALMGQFGENLNAALLPHDVWGNMLSRASGQGGSQLTSMTQNLNPANLIMGGLLGAGAFMGGN